jgi:type VI protein secretion system component Hcp
MVGGVTRVTNQRKAACYQSSSLTNTQEGHQMTSKSSLSDSNRSTSTHNKTLATDSTDNTLTDSELNLVGGGTKLTDAASPKLHLQCANGKHIAEVTIEL